MSHHPKGETHQFIWESNFHIALSEKCAKLTSVIFSHKRKTQIRFNFNFPKFVSALAYLANRLTDLDILKAVKIFYFADKEHLLEHGRPILGDTYVRWNYGPVPRAAKRVLDEFLCPEPYAIPFANLGYLREFLAVDATFKYPRIKALRAADTSHLSTSEIHAIDSALAKYGDIPSGRLIDEAHKEKSWENTSPNCEIDYRLFFEGHPEANDMREIMEEEQLDRDISEDLNSK
jgi:uncharacterized phage-associated protein